MQKVFKKIWSSGDVVLESKEITMLNIYDHLCSKAAIYVFTIGSTFNYKGTHNDVLSTVISIFNKNDKMESNLDAKILRSIRHDYLKD